MEPTLNTLLKRIIVDSIHLLGGTALVKALHRNKITILSVHSIMADSADVIWTPVRHQLHPDILDRTLAKLQRHYQFISFSHAVDILQGRAEPVKNGLVITMDDGYRNNITHGLPVFDKYNIKPIIFIAVGHVNEQKEFWFDRLDYALQQVPAEQVSVTLGDEEFSFNLQSRETIEQSYRLFRSLCKYKFDNDLDMLSELDRISSQLELQSNKALAQVGDDDWSRLVTWPQLKQAMEQNILDVGSHTVEHVRLSRVTTNIAVKELQNSKRFIQAELDHHCPYFCYPNGNYNEVTGTLVKGVGYSASVTTKFGLNAIGDDIHALKRITLPEQEKESELLYRLHIQPLIQNLKSRIIGRYI